MSKTQAIVHEAAPTGGVITYFHGTLSSLRFNIGGANDGWWWEGEKIDRDKAEALLETHTIRALVKVPGNHVRPSKLSQIMRG